MPTSLAILFGLAVFAVIVAVGWRSVQNRKILRVQGANGQETIIVAGEDDDVTSITDTVSTPVGDQHAAAVAAEPAAPQFGRNTRPEGAALAADTTVVETIGKNRLDKVVAANR
jgi:hypothetical protein